MLTINLPSPPPPTSPPFHVRILSWPFSLPPSLPLLCVCNYINLTAGLCSHPTYTSFASPLRVEIHSDHNFFPSELHTTIYYLLPGLACPSSSLQYCVIWLVEFIVYLAWLYPPLRATVCMAQWSEFGQHMHACTVPACCTCLSVSISTQ